jgi:hypothetical protein
MSEIHRYNPERERPIDTTAGVTERKIADFVTAHEPEARLTAGFDFAMRNGTFKRVFRDLLPYFEAECARTGVSDLREVRRMTHYMDKRTGIQSDLPDTTIAAILNQLESEALANDRRRVLDKDELKDIRESWEEDIRIFHDEHIEPALHRLELAITDADAKKEHAQQTDDERGLEKKEKELASLRAARSTLLERYLA